MSHANNIKYGSFQATPGNDFADGFISGETHTATQSQGLTRENCSQIPPGPSNLTTYLERDEAHERRSIGQPATPDPGAVAQDLDAWERQLSSTTNVK
jgi:hypothetical protein